MSGLRDKLDQAKKRIYEANLHFLVDKPTKSFQNTPCSQDDKQRSAKAAYEGFFWGVAKR